jgi:sarcosine oxidase
VRIAVIGAGVVGLSTAYALRRYPVTVRCYEAGEPMGGRSRGGTRIFRLAHETPALVRYAARARAGWHRWERTAGQAFVGGETVVISGAGAAEQYTAMRAAGVRCGLYDGVTDVPGLPTNRRIPGPFLVDPAGGVIQAGSTGDFLRAAVGRTVQRDAVERLTVTGETVTVHSERGRWVCDAVLVAAGTGTASLVHPLGITVPAELRHHVRFTFPLAESFPPMRCWLERSGVWRPDFTTYGHPLGTKSWALGGSVPAGDVAWSLEPAEARRRSLATVASYVTEFLGGAVGTVPTDEVYCAVTPGLGDGVRVARAGPVLAVWGENLFKFAPALGADLAAAVAARTLPDDLP